MTDSKKAAENEILLTLGYASCGIAAGAQDVLDELQKFLSTLDLNIRVKKAGCIGMCYNEPLLEVTTQSGTWMYRKVTPQKVHLIIEDHIKNGKPVVQWLVKEISTGEDGHELPFFKKQTRIVLRNTGHIDPEDIDEYIAHDGYKALEKALKTMTQDEIIKEVTDSGLRGRGGAGFPTGMKWGLAKKAVGDVKYLICNADEGDPGAFMDRNVLEGDPHSVLEGMIIAAYAIGCKEGYVYARAEYPLAVKRIKIAIGQAEKKGFLGDNILGTGFSFRLFIKEGAGAFVCGEETALIASIEGERGMPRIRPPYPANSGLWQKPTNNNNVETYANIPWILLNGAKTFRAIGNERAGGTKVFSLAGKIKRGGMVEVSIGMPLREIIFDIGGGILNDKHFKAVQLGGPSGGCVPSHLLDTPVDYESLVATGAIMGSGGMVVLDDHTCMVEVARFFMNFIQNESCGKCTFCRLGTRRMLAILTRITKGEGQPGDIEKLQELAATVGKSSLCGLGQTAPNPVLTTLRYFRDEYEAHINEKKCPAGQCSALITFHIDHKKCKACGMCKKACPNDAIKGDKRIKYSVDQDKCIKCGGCRDHCPYDAVFTR